LGNFESIGAVIGNTTRVEHGVSEERVVEIVSEVINGSHFRVVTASIVFENRFTKDIPHNFIQMSSSKNESEEVVSV